MIEERLKELFGSMPPPEGGGHVVPGAFIDTVVRRQSAWVYMSDEMREDMGYPPRIKGLRYWQNRERQAIQAASFRSRFRRLRRRIAAAPTHARYRLGHALLGDMDREDDRDY